MGKKKKFSLKRRKEMHKLYCRISGPYTVDLLEISRRTLFYKRREEAEAKLHKIIRIIQKINDRGVFKWYNRLWWY